MSAPTPIAMRSGLPSRLIGFMKSRYALAVGAQALVSAFHFVLNLSLLRLVMPHDYGLFAFSFVLAVSASAVSNAMAGTPLMVYTPVIRDPIERRRQEGMFATVNSLLFVAFGAGAALWAFGADHVNGNGIGVTLFVSFYAARQYSRNVSYARLQPLVVAASDIAYALSGAVLLGAVYLMEHTLPIGHVLCSVAAANAFAIVVERVLLNRYDVSARERTFFATVDGYARVWRESAAWSLVGALTTMFLAQAHGFIVIATNGPGAFAPLAAGFVLFGPVRMALLTWQNMVKPELAVDLAANRVGAVRARIRTTVWRMTAAVAALGILLAVAWPWVHEFLYARRYGEEPMALIVGLWCLVTMAAASYNAPSVALQASTDFRVLAVASIWGALVSGVLVTVALRLYAPEATLLGILAAEIFMALWITRALRRSLAAREAAAERTGVALTGPSPSTDEPPGTPDGQGATVS